MFDTTPRNAVRRVYDTLARNLAPDLCSRFTTEAERQFAASFNAASCAESSRWLHAVVSNAYDYAEPGQSDVDQVFGRVGQPN